MPIATQSVVLGGNVRVGLADSLFIGRGELAPDNASQVTKMAEIVHHLGLQVTSTKTRASKSNIRRRVWLPTLAGDKRRGWAPLNQGMHFHDLLTPTRRG